VGTIRVLIVDDHTIVREGLKNILNAEPDFDVVGLARNGREAVEEARKLRPDVVLMDVQMPELNGILATRYIKESCPETSVIMLTMFDRDEFLFEAVKEGATGYILKDVPSSEVFAAIRAAARGESLLHPAVARKLMAGFASMSHRRKAAAETPQEAADGLSSRELDVLRLIGTGLTNKQVADALFVSERTVKKHMTQILIKLSASSRTDAVITAVQRGLIRIDKTPVTSLD
jgi:DNA-binding NarL/FixJ family response regulator